MAQRTIDFGTFPDDPNSDAIRTAFAKVQDNFTEIYTNLQDQAVMTVNRTAGAGITVNSPTGNVVVTAKIACVAIRSSTLGLGTSGSGSNTASVAVIQSGTEYFIIDLPTNLSNIVNVTASGNIRANAINANISMSSPVFVATGNITGGNLITTGGITATGNANVGNIGATNGVFSANVSATGVVATTANITTLNSQTANVTGNISVGNVTATGAISAVYFTGDGANITGITAGASDEVVSGTSNISIATNANITSTVNSNLVQTIHANGVSVVGNIGATANVVAGNVYANTGTIGAASLAGTLTTADQPNITNIGLLVDLDVNGPAAISGNVTAGNVYANSGTVRGSLLTGTLTTNSQPNITSVGTLGNLVVSGNVSSGNLSVSGIISGDATGVSNIAAANIVGAVPLASAATVANTVSVNAQPNITSVGTLTSLTVTGDTVAGNVYANSGIIGAVNLIGSLTTGAQPNITAVGTLSTLAVTGNIQSGNANLGNLVRGNFFQGDGGLLTNVAVSAGTSLINGSSNVLVDASANVRISANGTANVFVVTNNGANVTGTLGVSGNVASGNLNAGNLLTANFVTGVLITASQPNITAIGTLGNLAVTSNISAGNISGNGHGLSSIVAANVIGTVATATIANTVSVAAQPNITSVGTLSAVTVSGNASVGNLSTSGTVAGAVLTGSLSTASQPNITTIGTLSTLTVTGNVASGNLNAGNLLTANFVTGVLTVNAQPNITSVGTLTSLSVSGVANLNTAANLRLAGGTVNQVLISNGDGTVAWSTPAVTTVPGANTQLLYNDGGVFAAASGAVYDKVSNNFSVSGNIFANSGGVSAVRLTGSLTTAAQPNITSVGTLTSLITSGNINAGNISVAAGTVTANIFSGNASSLSNIPAANVVGTIANAVYADGAGTVTTAAQPSITSVGTLTSLNVSGTITGNGAGISNIVAANIVGAVASATLATNVTASAQPNIRTVGSLTALNMSGVLTTSGNISTTSANSFYAKAAFPAVTMIDTANGNTAFKMSSEVGNIVMSFDTVGTGTFTEGWKFSSTGATAGLVSPVANAKRVISLFNLSNTVGAGVETRYAAINDLGSATVSSVGLDAANGLYLSSADTSANAKITFTINSNERLRITQSGNIGIGTTTPSSLLEVRKDQDDTTAITITNKTISANANPRLLLETGTTNSTVSHALYDNNSPEYIVTTGTAVNTMTTASKVHIWKNQAASAEFARIDVNGNVGIGTSSPTSKLHVNGVITGNAAGLTNIVASNVVGNVAAATLATNVTASAQPNIRTVGSLTSLNMSGVLTTSGNISTTAANSFYARSIFPTITLIDTSIPGNAASKIMSFGGNMYFTSDSVDGNLQNFVTFTKQYLVFGSVAPIDDAKRILEVHNRSNTALAGVEINLGSRNELGSLSNVYIGRDIANGFYINHVDSSPNAFITIRQSNVEHMRITKSGNVGIGTSTPSTKLQVTGTNDVATFTGATDVAIVLSDATANTRIAMRTGALAFDTNNIERFRIDQTDGIVTSTNNAQAVGYKGLPQVSPASDYTLIMADQGKHILSTGTTNTVRVPDNANVAFPVGTQITLINNASGSTTVIQNAGVTMKLANSGSTGNRTLATMGVATLVKIATDTWFIHGMGIS